VNCAEDMACLSSYRGCWYGDCIIPMMLTSLTAPDLTWLFLAVVVSLLAVAVWAFWEIEHRAQQHRKNDRFG
jgi:hypothetical protein